MARGSMAVSEKTREDLSGTDCANATDTAGDVAAIDEAISDKLALPVPGPKTTCGPDNVGLLFPYVVPRTETSIPSQLPE